MNDSHFQRAVVLLIHHSDEGTFGLILNRSTDSSLEDFWHTVSEAPCASNECLHVGGPVSGPLMALHSIGELGEIEIIPGLYFSAQRENVERLVSNTKRPYRLFIGHSGWAGGQLETEMDEGAWLIKPAVVAEVFSDESEIWQYATEQVGLSILADALQIRRFPENPVVN